MGINLQGLRDIYRDDLAFFCKRFAILTRFPPKLTRVFFAIYNIFFFATKINSFDFRMLQHLDKQRTLSSAKLKSPIREEMDRGLMGGSGLFSGILPCELI